LGPFQKNQAIPRLSPNPLSKAERALAYSRLYSLLSGLYLHGLTADNLESVRMVFPLGAALSEPLDLDAAAADHQHLFGFNVFPYESTFLDPSGLLGGPISDRLIQDYRASGYQPGHLSEGADHIGVELGFLAFLSRSESTAWADKDSEKANRLLERIMGFIDGQLFQWLAPFILSVRQQGDPFFSQLVDLTLESISQQRATFGRPESGTTSLPQSQPEAAEGISDTKQLSAYLLTPLLSGIFLSRDDIGRLSQGLSLPRGFGQRRHMIENLFQSAITYEQIPYLLSSLQRLLLRWETEYQELALQAGLQLQVEGWLGRVKETNKLLSRLAKEPFH
jgi:TorA maturation chaperone TorD